MTKSKATAKPANPKAKRVKKPKPFLGVDVENIKPCKFQENKFYKAYANFKDGKSTGCSDNMKEFGRTGVGEYGPLSDKPPFAVGQRWRMRNGGDAKIVKIEELRLYATHQVDGLDYEYFLDGEFYGRWGADYDLISLIQDAPITPQEKYYQNEWQRALGKVRSWEAMNASQEDDITVQKEKSHLEIKAEDDGGKIHGMAQIDWQTVLYQFRLAAERQYKIHEENSNIQNWIMWLALAILALQIAGMVMP
jgi:hypothetical protein